MKTTKQRIAEYKERLPKVKEKFIAMIALLIVSASMLTTVSFAWLALSVNPEVSGVNTAVAANGNLEIALANGTMKVPGATQIGDSDKDLIDKNITWGNLINLSDPSYGLTNMVLRPALLNIYDLTNSPLRSAVYTADGRFDELSTNFAYAKWQSYSDRDGGEFKLTDQYGLRAIMSTKYANPVSSGYNYYQPLKLAEVENKNAETMREYNKIVSNSDYINTLAVLMADFMDEKLSHSDNIGWMFNGNKTISLTPDLRNLRDIFEEFSAVLELEQQYYLSVANYQIFMKQYTDDTPNTATLTLDELVNAVEGKKEIKEDSILTDKTDNKGQAITVVLHGLSSNIWDKAIIDTHLKTLEALCDTNKDCKWGDIAYIVNDLINVAECYLDETQIGALGGSNAMGYLDGKTHKAIITNGVLKNYEQRTGANMSNPATQNVKVTLMNQSIIANIYTNADRVNSSHAKNLAKVTELDDTVREEFSLAEPQEIAHETYGFAIDFWVRTNALDSYLILEGNVLTETFWEDAKGKDTKGNEVQLYTVSESSGGSVGDYEITSSSDVFYEETKVNAVYDGTTLISYTEVADGAYILQKWFYHENYSPYAYFRIREATETESAAGTWYQTVVGEDNSVTYTTVADVTEPKWKQNAYEHVYGYEGENRVWDKNSNAFISVNSTTQGSGSCFVFYASTPEDQARGLELLASLKIAFVDDKGNLFTQAYLDTKRFYSDSGKVIVPLALDADSITIEEETGETHLAITKLEKNTAMLLTAIVYLDGTEISNEQVLAAADIQGQFNIQFGNAWDQSAASNDKLETEVLKLEARVSKDEFDYDSGGELKTTITANIDGVTPQKVEAFFIRIITDTQGVPLSNVVSFTNQGGGTWIADYEFPGPGQYVLRSLRIDGVEYDLYKDNPTKRPTVNISGFAVTGIYWDVGGSSYRWMTSASSVSTGVRVTLATDEAHMPDTVVGVFHSDGQTVTVNMKYNSTSGEWTGIANFGTSGSYVLDMLIIDGAYFEVDEQFQKTAEVVSGIKATVYTSSPTEFLYGLGEDKDPNTGDDGTGMFHNESNLQMQMKLLDNSGNEIVGLSDVWLYYGQRTSVSSVTGMSAKMTWNAVNGYYEGEMKSKPGSYEFLHVTVENDKKITTATTSPKFTIISSNQPTINESVAGENATQYTAGGPGKLSIGVNDTNDDTVVKAVIQMQNADGSWTSLVNPVQGNLSNLFNWSFEIEERTNKSGKYRISELQFWNVYVDGKMIDPIKDQPYVIELTEEQQKKTEVDILFNIKVELKHNGNSVGTMTLGKDGENITAAFMEVQNLNGITVTVLTDTKMPIKLKDGITLTYKYDHATSEEYGGYKDTSQNYQNFKAKYAGEEIIVLTEDPNNPGTFKMSSNKQLTYAGVYELVNMEFTLEDYEQVTSNAVFDENPADDTGKLQGIKSVVSVYSKKPTVKVTATDPATGSNYRVYTVSEPSNTNFMVEGDFFRHTDYSASVYLYTETSGGSYDQEASHAYVPKVTLALSGVPSGYSDASMTFTTSNASSVNSVFTFGSGTTATGGVGKVTDGEESWTGVRTYPKLYPAGSMSQNKMVLTYNGVSFEVTLSNTITIDQPQSPTVVTFAGIPTTYTGTKPATILMGGTTATVTLPMLTWTAEWDEADANATWTSWAKDTAWSNANHKGVYTVTERSESGWLGSKTYYRDYQYYNWVRYERHTTATTYHYQQDMQISAWIINGVTYPAGQPVTLTGEGTILAQAVVTAVGEKTERAPASSDTTYEYRYGYETGEKVTVTKVGNNYYEGGNVFNGAYSPTSGTVARNSAPTLANFSAGANITDDPDGYLTYSPAG